MNPRTFKAPTMAEALSLVKADLGADAIILHTRSFHTRSMLGLRRREMVEITAITNINIPKRRSVQQRVSTAAATYSQAGKVLPAPARMLQPPQPPQAPITRPHEPGSVLNTSAGTGAILQGVMAEMGTLKTLVQQMVSESRHQKCPQVPEDLFDYYLKLTENEVANEIATEIIRTLQRQIRPEYVSQPDYVRERLAEQLEKLIPVAGPIVRKKTDGPHVVALVGPTGVGKTTTIAKLAAHLKLREQRRVGLITLDTYRVAAVDQLKKYAEILGSPLKIVSSTDELRDAIAELKDRDFVLIDTAGRSPNDAMKLGELKALLSAIEPDEVHLVLASNASEACIDLAVRKFGELRFDSIIFTKLDEAAHVGVLLNVVRKVNKNLSYITTGQNVPADIEVGKGSRLARIILGEPV